MKVTLHLNTADEVNIVGLAMLQVAQRRDAEMARFRAERQRRNQGFTSEPIEVIEVAEVVPEPTQEEAKAALLAYADAKGMGAAVALLEKFNAKRVGEVAAERRAEFIAAATVTA